MLIAVEGIDGAGKTTLIRRLVDALAPDHKLMVERLAPVMVEIFKSRSDDIVGEKGRYQTAFPSSLRHESYIIEALVQMRVNARLYDNYDFVIFDRWTATNLVYLDYPATFRSYWEELISTLSQPDHYFWIRTPPALALERLIERGDWMLKRFTAVELRAKLEAWHERFEVLARQQDMITLDGSLPPREILADCLRQISPAAASAIRVQSMPPVARRSG